MSAGSLTTLILSSSVFCLFTVSSYAGVDWEEGFEYSTKAAQTAVWESSCPTSTDYMFSSTERPRSGSRSLKMEMLGQQGVTPSPPYGSCFMNHDLTGTSTTLYMRMYLYITGPNGTGTFTGGQASSKILSASTRNGPTNSYPNFWWLVSLWGGVKQSLTVESSPNDANTALIGKNISGLPLPQNQWVCWETRATLGSPGQANGIIEGWVNGQLSMNFQNVRLLVATPGQFGGTNSPYAQFSYVKFYSQNGTGIIYVDDFAVSRDARIGCGSSVSDPTPPAPPRILSIN